MSINQVLYTAVMLLLNHPRKQPGLMDVLHFKTWIQNRGHTRFAPDKEVDGTKAQSFGLDLPWSVYHYKASSRHAPTQKRADSRKISTHLEMEIRNQ